MIKKKFLSKSFPKTSQYDMTLILNGNFSFASCLRISKKSLYADDIWDWNDESNFRLALNRPNALRINWNKYYSTRYLPETIIEDLKKITYLIFFFGPQLFGVQKKLHPRTLCYEIKNIIRLLHLIVRQFTISNVCIIKTLADIEIEDLKLNISKVKSNVVRISLKKMLKRFANPFLKNVLASGPLKWTIADINKIDWKIQSNQNSYGRLPEGMFRFLSESATEDIKLFLHYLDITPTDKSKAPGLLRRIEQENTNSTSKDLIFEYIKFRRTSAKKYQNKKHQKNEKSTREKLRIRKVAALLNRTRLAAQIIILLYTGPRSSEARSFKFENIRREGDYWYIYGTVLKQRDIHAPVNDERWVVIPIMQDAVSVLRYTAQLVFSEYLFHGRNNNINKRNKPCGDHYIDQVATSYLKLIDPDGIWMKTIGKSSKKVRIHPHMFKESLAFELRKTNCGIPAITVQLKHKSFLDKTKINNCTLAYGRIGHEASSKAIEDANYELLKQLYHPDIKRSGGAAKEWNKELEIYFEGMAKRGHNIEEILRYYSKIGMSLMDVGVGFCQGKRIAFKNKENASTPCIGSLNCNPVDCDNVIIPESKIPIWEKVAETNRARANNPDFAHLKDTFEKVAEKAEDVLASFKRLSQKDKK